MEGDSADEVGNGCDNDDVECVRKDDEESSENVSFEPCLGAVTGNGLVCEYITLPFKIRRRISIRGCVCPYGHSKQFHRVMLFCV